MRHLRHGSRPSSSSGYRSRWEYQSWSQQPDPFAVNPIRRSALLIVASGLVGLALGIPVFLLSVGEELYGRLIERIRPSVDRLDLSPRIRHILTRHGYEAIALIEQTPDSTLLLLS